MKLLLLLAPLLMAARLQGALLQGAYLDPGASPICASPERPTSWSAGTIVWWGFEDAAHPANQAGGSCGSACNLTLCSGWALRTSALLPEFVPQGANAILLSSNCGAMCDLTVTCPVLDLSGASTWGTAFHWGSSIPGFFIPLIGASDAGATGGLSPPSVDAGYAMGAQNDGPAGASVVDCYVGTTKVQSGALSDNSENFAACVYDGTKVYVWLNGVMSSGVNATFHSAAAQGFPFALGPNTNQGLTLTQDDSFVYGKALTSAELCRAFGADWDGLGWPMGGGAYCGVDCTKFVSTTRFTDRLNSCTPVACNGSAP